MSKPGYRVFTKINRPAKELIEAFRGIPVANIGDNMGRIACMDSGMRPYNKKPLLGPAFTVKVPAGDNLMFHKALDIAQPGDILVIDGEGGMNRALCGEIMFTYALSKGIAGFIVDGCIRDIESLERLSLPVYARGVNPNGPYKYGPGEINIPLSVGGLTVNPGDILVGDFDGVVVIRPEDARELAQIAKKHNANEAVAFEQIHSGTYNRAWVDETLVKLGVEIL